MATVAGVQQVPMLAMVVLRQDCRAVKYFKIMCGQIQTVPHQAQKAMMVVLQQILRPLQTEEQEGAQCTAPLLFRAEA